MPNLLCYLEGGGSKIHHQLPLTQFAKPTSNRSQDNAAFTHTDVCDKTGITRCLG